MNKTDLTTLMAKETDLPIYKAEQVITVFVNQVTNALSQGDSVAIPGFGTFSVKERAERQGRNPRTGEEITIPAAKVASFKAGKVLKDAVKGKSEQSE